MFWTPRDDELEIATLEQWVDAFWALYEPIDRGRHLYEMWLKGQEDASRVGGGIRQSNFNFSLAYLAKTFVWTALCVKKIDEDPSIPVHMKSMKLSTISKVIWHKFPRICATCLRHECVCPLMRLKPPLSERRRVWEEKRLTEKMPLTVMEWEQMFHAIYSSSYENVPIEYIGFHFVEEIGEVCGALVNLYRSADTDPKLPELQSGFIEEVADVFSWTISLLIKFNQIRTRLGSFNDVRMAGPLNLNSVLMEEYELASRR